MMRRHVLTFRSVVLVAVAVLAACGPAPEGELELGQSSAGLITAGSQANADIAFASIAPAQIFHVAKWGNDANAGTSSAPWLTVAKAARTLLPGQAAYIHSGTYSENVTVGTRDGTATAPIALMAAPGETRPVVQGIGDHSVFAVSRAYWIIDGLDINAGGHQGAGVRVQGTHHVAIRNNIIHHGIGPNAVAMNIAHDVYVYKNTIYDYMWYPGGVRQDSHGIDVLPDSSRILIRLNDVSQTSGDAFQCKGPGESGFGTYEPVDIVLEDNRFHETKENAVDIKSCARITIRGGAADNNKFYGFRSAEDTGAHCGGSAMVLHWNARNILIEKTRFWDAGIGIAIGRDDVLTHDIVIRHNVFFNMTTALNGCGHGVRVARAQNVEVSNNTFDNIPASAIRVGSDNAAGSLSSYVSVYNNIVRNAAYALDVWQANAPGFTSDRNILWRTDGTAAPLRLTGGSVDLTRWRSVLVTDALSKVADPLFVSGAGAAADYYTQTTSPARDVALNLTGSTYCGTGPDIGFLETCQ